MSVTFDAGTKVWSEDFQANLLTATCPDDLAVNMSNSNAASVASTLGISMDPDWCGHMDAEEFLGRILLAQAISPADEGMPSYEHPRPHGGPRIIEGARPVGYLQQRLTQLRALADWAIANQALILWA